MGRIKNKSNLGYWFRGGRGWYMTVADKACPLRDAEGQHLRDEATPHRALQEALARGQQAQAEYARHHAEGDSTTVRAICERYLTAIESTKSYPLRAGTLFDFCNGLPARFRGKKDAAKPADRLHKGYGDLPIGELKAFHIHDWLAAHPTWGVTGARRTAIQALKRAFNYCQQLEIFHCQHPLQLKKADGRNVFQAGVSAARATYLSSEQEQAAYSVSKPAFAQAMLVCIRTGARSGCEFAALEARHVKETPNGQLWEFAAPETKMKKKKRVIMVPPDIAAIVRELVKRYPTGKLFRTSRGKPWTASVLNRHFQIMMRKAKRKLGIEFDADACFYATRHTFAQRLIIGYGNRVPLTLEVIAERMGNTRTICDRHYSQIKKDSKEQQDAIWATVV